MFTIAGGKQVNSSRWLWRVTGLAAMLSALLLACGFAYAIKDILYPQSSELLVSPPADKSDNGLRKADKLQIVALGDSLTRGTGDQSGKGYVGEVKELLANALNKPVYVIANYSVNGYTTKQLWNDIVNKSEVPVSIARADIVMLTIGGNDLFGLVTGNGNPLENGGRELNPEQVRKQLPDALARLKQILDKVAELNPRAPIFYIGLYNPFEDFDESKQSSLIIDEWNRGAFEVANRYSNMKVIPTSDLFKGRLADYLYSDHFHPNQEGYRMIAERILQNLR
jgi:lysophospholipase L1-like esterase